MPAVLTGQAPRCKPQLLIVAKPAVFPRRGSIIPACLLALALLLPFRTPAAPALEGEFSQVINQVDVVTRATKAVKPAKVRDSVRSPDWVRTGPKARAELVAPDQTITRIGANSLFSFEPDGRTLRLEQGSLLFHSPPGRGGGTVRTGGAVAAVLGTTLIVSATADGGFKTLVLEGRGKVTLPSGQSRQLQAGQLIFVLGGTGLFGPLLDINLGKLVEGSALIKSFDRKLPSLEKIEREIQRQERRLSRGDLEDTGELIGGQNRENERNLGAADASILDRIFGDEYIPAVRFAMDRDTQINRPTLDPTHVFLDGFDLQLYNFPYDDYIGFAGRNVTLQTPLLTLGPFSAETPAYFDIVAAKELTLPQSITIQAQDPLPLFFTGIDRLLMTPGVICSYDNPGGLHLVSGGSAPFLNNTILDPQGPVWLQSVNGELSISSSRLSGATVDLHAANDLLVADSTITGTSRITVASRSDQLAPKPGDFSTIGPGPELFGTAGNITIARTSFTGGVNGELISRAADTLRLDAVGLNSISTISLAARTLDLSNLDFPAGSSVSLASSQGVLAPNPNTGATSVPGHVNFIINVNYGGVPAQNAIGAGITIQKLP